MGLLWLWAAKRIFLNKLKDKIEMTLMLMTIFGKVLKGAQENRLAIILYAKKKFFQKNLQEDRLTQWLFSLKRFDWHM